MPNKDCVYLSVSKEDSSHRQSDVCFTLVMLLEHCYTLTQPVLCCPLVDMTSLYKGKYRSTGYHIII